MKPSRKGPYFNNYSIQKGWMTMEKGKMKKMPIVMKGRFETAFKGYAAWN